MPPVILVAPAAFKGTLGPRQVAEALAAGVRRAVPGAAVLECPVADGGNGLLDVVLPVGALRERLQVTGPIGDSVSAEMRSEERRVGKSVHMGGRRRNKKNTANGERR